MTVSSCECSRAHRVRPGRGGLFAYQPHAHDALTTGSSSESRRLVRRFPSRTRRSLGARADARESSVPGCRDHSADERHRRGTDHSLSGYPVSLRGAERPRTKYGRGAVALTLTERARRVLDRRATALLTLSTASLADFTSIEVCGRFFHPAKSCTPRRDRARAPPGEELAGGSGRLCSSAARSK